MSKFRVGDLVTGKLETPYWLCHKDSIRENFHDDLYVRVVSHIYYKEAFYFNLYKEKTNFRRNK